MSDTSARPGEITPSVAHMQQRSRFLEIGVAAEVDGRGRSDALAELARRVD